MRALTAPISLSLGLLFALAGCRGGDGDASSSQDAAAGEPTSEAGMPGALAMGSLFAAQAKRPGLYDPPDESPGFSADADHVAVLELSEPVVELRSLSFFGDAGGIELRTILEHLHQLAGDEHVKGIVLRVDAPGLSMAQAEELRGALARFRGEGERAVACHTEGATGADYYLLSACDSIGLAPGGHIGIAGVAATPIHIKGLLDKLGVRADFLHVGAFKGAAEPLTRDAPSPEMRETLGAILDDAYASMVAGIAAGRELDEAAVRERIDTAVFSGEAAVEAGLVDEVAVFERFRDQAAGDADWTRVSFGDESEPGMGELMELLGMTPRTRPAEPHVALVYAVGAVVDGEGDGPLGVRSQIASRPLSAALRRLAAEDSVKAVVLRVDSGGGSALASELIWQAVEELGDKKPVIVSMGGMAASGGYYIGCGAETIYALENTLTGSIGVVGGKLAIGRALAGVGVTAHPMGRGERALMWSALQPWNEGERATVQAMMQTVYDTFLARVAAGRDKSTEEVHAVAQGRIWTGADAREKGLVDQIGGLDDALAAARELAKVGADAPLEVYPPEPTLLDLIGSFGVSAPLGARGALAQLARDLGPREAAAVAETLRAALAVGDAPIQTAIFWPLVIR